MWEKLVIIPGLDDESNNTFRTEPKSLKFMAKESLTRGRLIALPHVFDVGIGLVWECSETVFFIICN